MSLTEHEKKEIIKHRVEQSSRTIIEADLFTANEPHLALKINLVF